MSYLEQFFCYFLEGSIFSTSSALPKNILPAGAIAQQPSTLGPTSTHATRALQRVDTRLGPPNISSSAEDESKLVYYGLLRHTQEGKGNHSQLERRGHTHHHEHPVGREIVSALCEEYLLCIERRNPPPTLLLPSESVKLCERASQ